MPNGPGKQTCLICKTVISTNALARSAHERSKRHQAALVSTMLRLFRPIVDKAGPVQAVSKTFIRPPKK